MNSTAELFELFEVPTQQRNQQQVLIDKINELVEQDFAKLIFLLYRFDINEKKLKSTLTASPGKTAGELILPLLLERAAQKAESRNNFKKNNSEIPEDEKW